MSQRFISWVFVCCVFLLGGCTSSPAMEFELLAPRPGEVGANIIARLVVTGTEDVSFDSHIKVIDVRYPNTEFRSVACAQACDPREIAVHSGTFEVFGTMTYVDRDGGSHTLTSERFRVEIDATPIVAVLIPPLPTSRQLRVLLTRPVLDSSVTPDTLSLERTFQSGPVRYHVATEPVPIQVALTDRIITVTGDFSAPARYVLRIRGVRDTPGNKVDQALSFDRQYFTHGPDLYEHIGGQFQRLERDDQQRLYHLALDRDHGQQRVSRLEGTTWVDVVTLPVGEDTLATLDRQGRPVAFSAPVRGGDVLLKRWNGSTWEAWGPPIHESGATGFFFVRIRMDPQNRPLVLVTSGANAPVTESLQLYRLDGATWTSLPHPMAPGSVEHTFFPLGDALAVGWKSRSSQGAAFAARVDEGGLTALSVPSGAFPDWDHAVASGPSQSFVPTSTFSARSAVMRYDGQSLTEVGDMRGYLDPTDPTGGNTVLGDVRTLTVDETGAPTVFMRSRIYAGKTDGENLYRFILSALRFDGQTWTPLRGAPAAVLMSGEPEVAWMSSLAVGSTPVALEAAYTPQGALWMLQLRGYVSGGVARSYLLRALHAP